MRTYSPAFAQVEDDALVSLAQDGDNSAFAELVQRHSNICQRLAVSILRNQEDAEDEVQNAVWKAYQHLAGFNQEAKFSTWLSRIVVNQCLMRLRKDKRARFIHLEAGVPGEELQTIELPDESAPLSRSGRPSGTRSPDAGGQPHPAHPQGFFLMRDVQEIPTQHVAERLGIHSQPQVALRRARIELRAG